MKPKIFLQIKPVNVKSNENHFAKSQILIDMDFYLV